MINLDNFKVANCKLIKGYNDKIYSFRLYDTYGETAVGDVVAVDILDGFGLAEIVEIIPLEDFHGAIPYKDVIGFVSPIDYKNYIARIEAKKEQKKINAKKKQLRKKLNHILNDKIHIQAYRLLAEDNPELKQLLDEYKALDAKE